jgi:radical SAM protein with 4Fe4S-binding SPASM domain
MDMIMRPSEVREFFDIMYGSRKKLARRWFNRTDVRMNRALQFIALKEHGEPNIAPYTCSAGRTLLAVLPDGSLLPCRRMPIITASLLEMTISEAYSTSLLLKGLRSFSSSEECSMCLYRESCRGGLRCLSYACHGDPFRADPQCYLIHPDTVK